MSPSLPHIDIALSLKGMAQTATRRACEYALRQCAPWDSVSEGDWPASQMAPVATLRGPSLAPARPGTGDDRTAASDRSRIK